MNKLLIYSHDTYGLGNIRRMLSVVEHLVEQDPKMSALILSGSPMMQAFRLSERIDYIKLPCLERDQNGTYGSKFLELSYERLLSLRADLILNTILNFEPDLIIVDKKPLGVQNEIAPALDVLRRRANRAKLVLMLREILDDPATTTAVWERNGYHDTIREFYDAVLVVGSQNVFDTAQEYQFPETTQDKLHYCGYIKKPNNGRPAEQVRNELGIKDQDLVVVTAGGGKDGFRLMGVALSAFAAPTRLPKTHLLLILGPEMDQSERDALVSASADCESVTVYEYTTDMMSYLNAASVVVSMAGYNTVTELLSLQKPAVLVPRTVPVLEQWIRATRLEKLGLFSVIHPDQLTPRNFTALLRRALKKAGRPADRCHIDMNGLENISLCVARLLRDRNSNGWPKLLLKPGGVETGEFAQVGHQIPAVSKQD